MLLVGLGGLLLRHGHGQLWAMDLVRHLHLDPARDLGWIVLLVLIVNLSVVAVMIQALRRRA